MANDYIYLPATEWHNGIVIGGDPVPLTEWEQRKWREFWRDMRERCLARVAAEKAEAEKIEAAAACAVIVPVVTPVVTPVTALVAMSTEAQAAQGQPKAKRAPRKRKVIAE